MAHRRPEPGGDNNCREVQAVFHQGLNTQGFGTLINVASALGRIPAPHYTTYAATKYAIVGRVFQNFVENRDRRFRTLKRKALLTNEARMQKVFELLGG